MIIRRVATVECAIHSSLARRGWFGSHNFPALSGVPSGSAPGELIRRAKFRRGYAPEE